MFTLLYRNNREQNVESQNADSVGPDTDTYTSLKTSVDTSQTYTSLHLPDNTAKETQQEKQTTYETLQNNTDDYYNMRAYATLQTADRSTASNSDDYENSQICMNGQL